MVKIPQDSSGFYWPGGTSLLLLNGSSMIKVNLAPVALDTRQPIQAPGRVLAISPTGGRVLAQAGDGGIVLWDRDDGSKKPVKFGVAEFAAFSPDGKLLLLGSNEKIEVTILDAETLQVVYTLSGFETAAPVYEALMSPDGKRLLWHARARVEWMDISSGKFGPVYELQNFIDGVAISPDGQALVLSAGDLLWAYYQANGSNYSTSLLPGPQGAVSPAAFSADGRLLAAGVEDKIYVWETENWKQVSELGEGKTRIHQLSFSPDGRVLAALDQDGQLSIWRVP